MEKVLGEAGLLPFPLPLKSATEVAADSASTSDGQPSLSAHSKEGAAREWEWVTASSLGFHWGEIHPPPTHQEHHFPKAETEPVLFAFVDLEPKT